MAQNRAVGSLCVLSEVGMTLIKIYHHGIVEFKGQKMDINNLNKVFLEELDHHGKYVEVYLAIWPYAVLVRESKLIDYKYFYYLDGNLIKERCKKSLIYADFLDGLKVLLERLGENRQEAQTKRLRYRRPDVKRFLRKTGRNGGVQPCTGDILKTLLESQNVDDSNSF